LKPDIQSGRMEIALSEHVGKGIAIIDDDEELCSLFQLLVKDLGYETEFIGHDGSEVVDAVLRGRVDPELIIMDYRMPTMNGVQAADAIRRIKPGAKIILATADDSVKSEAISSGLFYIQKPFSIETLKSIIEGAIRKPG
jgi:CheY-like chemotaxis protein